MRREMIYVGSISCNSIQNLAAMWSFIAFFLMCGRVEIRKNKQPTENWRWFTSLTECPAELKSINIWFFGSKWAPLNDITPKGDQREAQLTDKSPQFRHFKAKQLAWATVKWSRRKKPWKITSLSRKKKTEFFLTLLHSYEECIFVFVSANSKWKKIRFLRCTPPLSPEVTPYPKARRRKQKKSTTKSLPHNNKWLTSLKSLNLGILPGEIQTFYVLENLFRD